MSHLEALSHWASILTLVLGLWAYVHLGLRRFRQRYRLEKYLKQQKREGTDRGQRSIVHLSARVGLTETEIMDAAFRSSRVKLVIKADEEGMARQVLLEYQS